MQRRKLHRPIGKPQKAVGQRLFDPHPFADHVPGRLAVASRRNLASPQECRPAPAPDLRQEIRGQVDIDDVKGRFRDAVLDERPDDRKTAAQAFLAKLDEQRPVPLHHRHPDDRGDLCGM